MSRDGFRKTELEHFTEMYARRAVIRSGYRPEDMEELTDTKEWQESSSGQREKACRIIREMARPLLIKAGYSRSIVYRNIP